LRIGVVALACPLARSNSRSVAVLRPYTADRLGMGRRAGSVRSRNDRDLVAADASPTSWFSSRGFGRGGGRVELNGLFGECSSGARIAWQEGGSDNPYLRPDNSLRLAKGFFTALVLLHFLRARTRTHGDALAWLSIGMATGLALVALAVLAERAVFTSPFDFTTSYRVVGTFSSMNIGGGHIGAYIAMALPFLLVCLLRPRPLRLFAMSGTAIGAGYALAVSYARTAYVAALISTLSAGAGWAWAARHRNSGTTSALALSALGLLTIGGILVAAIRSDFMSERLRTVVFDLGVREENWSSGLALRGDSRAGVLFGKGLGTYPRIVLASKPGDR